MARSWSLVLFNDGEKMKGKWRYSLSACSLSILCLIVLVVSPDSAAWANDDTGIAIITLNVPAAADGAPADPYHAYYVRAQRKDGRGDVHFLWHEGWAVSTGDDLAAVGGHGAIIMKELSAGDWEVNTFRLQSHGGFVRVRWSPAKEFSIPFTIRPGRATYIGSYQPVAYKFGGARFVVTDQSARDIPIAKAKKPDLGPVDVEVFDVDKLHHPLLSGSTVSSVPDEAAFGN
jgi:hypothetical protein